jgi:predicted ABC-type ATPase
MSRFRRGSMSTATTVQTALIDAEFACTDASCAPPPVGTGGSKPKHGKGFGGPSADPKNRVSPMADLDPDIFDLPSRSMSFARSVWKHELPGGATSEVTDIPVSSWNPKASKGHMFVKGKIYDKDLQEIGQFERELDYDGINLSVKHEFFGMERDQRNTGIGSAFNRESLKQYREIGVDHIDVEAGMSVGGYAWAREGFRLEPRKDYWSEKDLSRHDQLVDLVDYGERQLNDLYTYKEISKTIYNDAKSQLVSLVKASVAGEDVQPIHIASIGEETARFQKSGGHARYETWPGKEMLLGSTWNGRYYLDADAPVTASATASGTCEHGNLVAACYSASCRPPTSGGTGGSRGYGPRALRDVRLGGVKVTYDPKHPDGGPDPGEIVWAKIPFEDDPMQSKDRPVLVIGRVNGSTTFAAVQLTSQIKGRKWELPIGSGSWDRSGKPSALNLSRIVQVGIDNFRREGSVFDPQKFDAVIDRLSKYHNTAITAAAQGHIEEFKFNAGQPRDRLGRWSRVGGSPNLEAQAAKCTPPPCVKASIERSGIGRTVLHRRIVRETLEGANPPPHVTILGGGGGAGKSTIVKRFGIGKNQATVNADDIKERIPEYSQLVKAGDRSAAAFVHEESSKIAQDVQTEARKRGVGLVLDQVGADPRKVTAQVRKFVAAGYKDIDAVYVTVPTQVAVERAESRAQRTGRAVPLEILRAAHRDVSRGFEGIAKLAEIRDIKLYDNTGTDPVLVASGGRGRPLVIHDRALYDTFLAKGDE